MSAQNMVPGVWYEEHQGRYGQVFVMKDEHAVKKYYIRWDDVPLGMADRTYVGLSQGMGKAREMAFSLVDEGRG